MTPTASPRLASPRLEPVPPQGRAPGARSLAEPPRRPGPAPAAALACALALLAACSGPAQVEVYDRIATTRPTPAATTAGTFAATAVDPERAAALVVLDALPADSVAGSLLVVRDATAPALDGVPRPVLGWLEVLDPDARSARTLGPLELARLEAGTVVLERVDGAEAIAAVPDKTLTTVSATDGRVTLARGSLELVAVGDLYALGEPATEALEWALLEVVEVSDTEASARLVAGDRLPRVGERVVWSGTTLPGAGLVRVALRGAERVDGDAARELRFELERAGLSALSTTSLELVALTAPDPTRCETGRALAAAPGLAEAQAGIRLVAELAPLPDEPERVALGWSRWPADGSQVSLPDVLGRCLHTRREGAVLALRLATLAATQRWRELHHHASALLRTPGAVPDELGLLVSLWQARALLELGDAARATSVLEAATELNRASLEPAQLDALELYRAQQAFDLGRLDEARARLDAIGTALPAGLEPARAVLAASLALASDPATARAELDASTAREHAVLVAWRTLLDSFAGDGDVLKLVQDIDLAGGEALAGWPGASAALLEVAAQLALARGQAAQAATLLDEARVRYRLAGEPFRAGAAQLKLAEALSSTGFPLEAAEVAMIAATDLAEAGALREGSQVLLGAAALLDGVLRDPESDEASQARALELIAEALRVARVLSTHANDVGGVARAWSQLGEVLVRHFGDAQAAAEAFEAAVFYALRAGDLGRAAQGELAIALALRAGDASDAATAATIAEHLASARQLAEAAGDARLLEAIARVE